MLFTPIMIYQGNGLLSANLVVVYTLLRKVCDKFNGVLAQPSIASTAIRTASGVLAQHHALHHLSYVVLITAKSWQLYAPPSFRLPMLAMLLAESLMLEQQKTGSVASIIVFGASRVYLALVMRGVFIGGIIQVAAKKCGDQKAEHG